MTKYFLNNLHLQNSNTIFEANRIFRFEIVIIKNCTETFIFPS
jgi:hypothetical protein